MHEIAILLRGINVGGKNKLPMSALRSVLEELGLEGVATYIQSGNAVARARRKPAKTLGAKIAAAIEDAHGFAPHTLVRTRAQLEQALAANPFPQACAEPKTLHVFFLEKAPAKPDLDAIAGLAAASERFALDGERFYLHAPDGIARSKLAARVEKLLGAPATARNWRTVQKLREMLDA